MVCAEPHYKGTLLHLRHKVFQAKDVIVYFGDAMADTQPLSRLLKLKVTQKMVDEIGAEYAKGRLLFLSTTNLDARRPVIWNVTKIAARHKPEALELHPEDHACLGIPISYARFFQPLARRRNSCLC